MWKKLSLTIKSIIDDKNNNININDNVKKNSIKIILKELTKRNLDNQQKNYLRDLIEISISFKPITQLTSLSM